MKMLVHRTPDATELPVSLEDAKQYMRVEFDDEDTGIANIIYTAAAEIE